MAKWKYTNENKKELAALLDEKPKIAYWQLAEVLGLHENTISKYMRRPTDEQTALIKGAIKEIRADMQ